jgi:hypothetical protein
VAFYQGATTIRRDTATPKPSSSRLHASEILERVCGLMAIQYDPSLQCSRAGRVGHWCIPSPIQSVTNLLSRNAYTPWRSRCSALTRPPQKIQDRAEEAKQLHVLESGASVYRKTRTSSLSALIRHQPCDIRLDSAKSKKPMMRKSENDLQNHGLGPCGSPCMA